MQMRFKGTKTSSKDSHHHKLITRFVLANFSKNPFHGKFTLMFFFARNFECTFCESAPSNTFPWLLKTVFARDGDLHGKFIYLMQISQLFPGKKMNWKENQLS
jgi:hypothetical protein